MKNLTQAMDRYFKISERGSSVKTEIMAGLTTFMVMIFLAAVHPSIMAQAGMDKGAMVTTTLLTAAIFTIFCGLYCNLPFALATAMGSNALIAFTIVGAGVASWEVALGMNFISGIIFLLLTVCGLRDKIVNVVPKSVKLTMGAIVGVFLVGTGLGNVKMVSVTGSGFLALQNLRTPEIALFTITLALIVIFMARNFKGGILLAIAIGTLIGIPMGITTLPDKLISLPPSIEPIAFKLDILGALKFAYIPFIFVFFVGDFFSTLGTVLGCGQKANLLDENGDLPEINKPFLVDSVGTVVGTLMGTNTVTTYVQSAAGVEAGGRTGLTALSTGFFFLVALFFTPIALMVPNPVSAAALVMIGISMLTGLKSLNFDDAAEYLPALIGLMGAIFSYNIAVGVSLGIIAHVLVMVCCGRAKEIHWSAYVMTIPLAYYLVFLL